MKLTDAENAADGIFFPALEQNMMGAVLINENDEVMFFNPAAEKLWGYKREEVIGNNIDMLIPRDLRPAHPEYIRHNREGGKARVEGMSRELQLEKKDGSKIWTRFALSKVSAEGKVYYLALVRDASVEMAQKEQTRQLIIAVDHLDRPVIVLDPERHIVQCNRAFTEMFGYCISEASGMQPDTLLNIPEFPADNRIRLQQLLWKTARDQDEFLLLTRTGEKIWIKASISPVYDVLAHLQNLVMTFSDITEERQIRQIELKYACVDNITGKAIYQQARCLLHKDAITALAKSISIAQLSGLQLVIYDAYRPQQAQAMLWQACPDPQYVVDVTVGSNHSRGTALDLTLRDEHGNILDMAQGSMKCTSAPMPITLPSPPPLSAIGCC
ncbi:hypothetical protein JNE071324_1799 [Escherichia coli]|nr:hypothetical protein JNE071324_1799 [Escherichia coli]